jgi:hypothetical protein
MFLLVSVPLALAGAEVRTGDTIDSVRTALGVPRGQLKIGPRQLLYYDRGEVELQAGAVTRVALMSETEYAAMEARRADDAARLNAEMVRRNADGEALKARRLSDPTFLSAPLSYQLAFWQNFSLRYPGVPVDEQLTVAHLRLAEQYNQQQAQEARLAELEARVNDAESRSDSAERHVYPIVGGGYYGDYGYSGGYGYYRGERNRHGSTLWPVQYHFSNTFAPVITPFNPNIVPVSHRTTNGVPYRNSNCSRSDGGGYGRRGRM